MNAQAFRALLVEDDPADSSGLRNLLSRAGAAARQLGEFTVDDRAKNNLQVVSSLLHMQARRTADSGFKIVATPAEQLGATLDHESRRGTRFCLSFSCEQDP